jgi:hypothetical protein
MAAESSEASHFQQFKKIKTTKIMQKSKNTQRFVPFVPVLKQFCPCLFLVISRIYKKQGQNLTYFHVEPRENDFQKKPESKYSFVPFVPLAISGTVNHIIQNRRLLCLFMELNRPIEPNIWTHKGNPLFLFDGLNTTVKPSNT